jgi:hypothetical protein
MSCRRCHAKKEVESALDFAERNGWRVESSTGNGHAWGRMYCPYNNAQCRCGEFCITSIWCTPRNAGSHAKILRRVVDNCVLHKRVVVNLDANAAGKRRAREAEQSEQQEQEKESSWNSSSH